jgi:hypothetical protein
MRPITSRITHQMTLFHGRLLRSNLLWLTDHRCKLRLFSAPRSLLKLRLRLFLPRLQMRSGGASAVTDHGAGNHIGFALMSGMGEIRVHSHLLGGGRNRPASGRLVSNDCSSRSCPQRRRWFRHNRLCTDCPPFCRKRDDSFCSLEWHSLIGLFAHPSLAGGLCRQTGWQQDHEPRCADSES